MSVVLLSITLLAFTLQIGTQPVAMAVPPRQSPPLTPGSSSTALMAITPSNFSDTSLTSGTVSYTVNVYNSSAINQFDVRITYNYNVLNGASIDYSSNVLGPNVLILYNCLDGVYGGACDTLDGPGVVHMSLYIQGNVSITPPTAGILMKVKFNIVGHGFTQLHLVPGGAFGSDLLCALCAHGVANAPLTTVVPLTTQDAYFNNILCGGVLCKPPVADFTFSPSIALPGRSVTFNATASRATNVNAVIKQYFWQWNDGSIASNTDSNVTSHVFKNVNNQTVTLTVTDSDGISWSSTLIVPVIAVYIQLIAGQITMCWSLPPSHQRHGHLGYNRLRSTSLPRQRSHPRAEHREFHERKCRDSVRSANRTATFRLSLPKFGGDNRSWHCRARCHWLHGDSSSKETQFCRRATIDCSSSKYMKNVGVFCKYPSLASDLR